MRSIKILSIASMFIMATACNNGSNEQTKTDSSSAADHTTTETTVSHADSSGMATGTDLMQPMQTSMGRMQSMQMSGDFDIDFANMMIEHHQGAIDMSRIELANGKDETMKTKAQEIITKQTAEQQQLRDFVKSYKPSGMKHGEGELQKSTGVMNTKMQGMKMSGDVDKDFAMMMTQHHLDGISMMKMEVKNGMSSDLKKMAQKGIDDQQKDIKEFQNWMPKK